MGRSFSSTHIYNSQRLDKEEFLALFCEKMQEAGYITGNETDYTLAYVFAFTDDCQWVTICSDAWKQGNIRALEDAKSIAKMLNARCININIVDSDFAILQLYSQKGIILDTTIVGNATCCIDANSVLASRKEAWEPLLSANCTWEHFTAIQNGKYIFAEDALTELAPLLGMDRDSIMLEAEVGQPKDSNRCMIYLKKQQSKKEISKAGKRITLNTAFKNVFGTTLEPYGFVKTKGKHPYLVRVINDEIVQVITILNENTAREGQKAFAVYGGVATVYRQILSLDINPERNRNWLQNISGTFAWLHENTERNREYADSISAFYYNPNSNDSVLYALEEALEATICAALPLFEQIKDLSRCTKYLSSIGGTFLMWLYHPNDQFGNNNPNNFYNEGLLYVLSDSEFVERWNESYRHDVDELHDMLAQGRITKEDHYERCAYRQMIWQNALNTYNEICNNSDYYHQAMSELAKRKQNNLTVLQQLGVSVQ